VIVSTENIPLSSMEEVRAPYVNVGELRTMLREQKQKLRCTSPQNQVKKGAEQEAEQVVKENEKSDSLTDLSIDSGVVRLTINTAKNKENFNYLIGDKPNSGGNSEGEEEEKEEVKELREVNEINFCDKNRRGR